MIEAAAIKYGDLICFIPKPARHHNILHKLSDMYNSDRKADWAYAEEKQGFITDTGEFLDRKSAKLHAQACGQFRPEGLRVSSYNGDELFSEDLW